MAGQKTLSIDDLEKMSQQGDAQDHAVPGPVLKPGQILTMGDLEGLSKPGTKVGMGSKDPKAEKPPTTKQILDFGVDSIPFVSSQLGALAGGAGGAMLGGAGAVPGAIVGAGVGGAAGNAVKQLIRGGTEGFSGKDVAVEGATDAAGEMLGQVANMPLRAIAKRLKPTRLIESAIHPNPSLPMNTRDMVVNKMLNTDLKPGKEGYQEARDRIARNMTRDKGILRDPANAGKRIEPMRETRQVIDDLKNQFRQQATPKSDLKTIRSTDKEFTDRFGGKPATAATSTPTGILDAKGNPVMKTTPGKPAVPPTQLSPYQAWKIKSGTSKKLSDKSFDALGSAAVETQKAYIKGIGDAIVSKIPELGPGFKDTHEYIELMNVLGQEAKREGNSRLFGLKATVMAGSLPAGDYARALADGALLMLDMPRVKVALGRAINKMGKTAVGKALGNNGQYILPAAGRAVLGGSNGVLAPPPQ